MHNSRIVLAVAATCIALLSAILAAWLTGSVIPDGQPINAVSKSNAAVGDNSFTNELVARGLIDCLNDSKLNKDEVLESFCLSFQLDQSEKLQGGRNWIGHSLLDNPYDIQFTYKSADGVVVASVDSDTIWQDHHSPSDGDLLQVKYRQFVKQVKLTKSESALVYVYFFGE